MAPLPIKRLLTVIVNHNCNAGAIALKKNLSPFCDTVLLDSGSKLTEMEMPYFDCKLPNVYYNGLLNKASELAKMGNYSHMLFITSDVIIDEPEALFDRIHKVYEAFIVGVYAPSAKYSTHHHMNNLGSNRLRKVTFVEGFCFVTPLSYLEEICPIDLAVNKIGHGVDIYLGFLSMATRRYAMVDDGVTVDHPHGSGYSDQDARAQRDAWFRLKKSKVRIFHYLVSNNWLKNNFGFHFVNFIMKLL
ncbi:MAG: hypothetical protein ACYC18_10970 [Gammaproteobacteria bacterium]|nr:hypothetical protein [Gammaproteobacteria bacterium]